VQFPTAAGGIFNLFSNTIVLDGFVIQNNADDPGIYTSPLFSDYLITRNTIQNNVFGLYFNSNGLMQSVVYDNTFNGNNLAGAASGDGIYSDAGLRNALVDHNYFTGHQSASMVYVNAQDILVTRNFITDDNSVVFVNSSDATAEQNFLRRPRGTGFFLGGGNTDVTIDNNLVDAPDGNGVSVNNIFSGAANANTVIQRNLIGDAAFAGIALTTTDGATVKRNIVLRSGTDGIRLTGSSHNEIAGNNSLHNGRDGIRVTGQSSNNRIVSNNLKQNAEFDAYDDTVGPGSGGTANYWIDNSCQTENRPGLCEHGRDDSADAADTTSYDTALAADPYATGDFVMPTFDVPEDPVIPLLPDLDLLGLAPQPLI
jgi:parallel beta-helix repeat protein